MSCVEAEMTADAEQGEIVGLRCIRLDAPVSIDDGGVWVYQRREDGAS